MDALSYIERIPQGYVLGTGYFKHLVTDPTAVANLTKAIEEAQSDDLTTPETPLSLWERIKEGFRR